MIKKFLAILLLVAIAGFSQTADPGRTPRWDGLMDYVKNGQYTMTYKTLTSPTITGATLTTPTLTGATVTGGLTLNGNISSNNLFVVSDGDSTKIRMYKYLYPYEMEIGNTQKVAFDSAGNAIFAGTVSAAAFSPTTSSAIQSASILVLSDSDSLTLNPYQAQYLFRLGVGGAKKFAVDSAGAIYGTSFSGAMTVNGKWTLSNNYPWTVNTLITADSINVATLGGSSGATAVNSKLTIANNYPMVTTSSITADSVNVTTLAGSSGAMAVNTKMTIAANYPFVTNSTVTVDSLVTPRIAGVSNATEVKSKLTVAANYPFVSSSSVMADTLEVTGGNVYITDIDTVATAGNVSRWLRLTISKAGATGKPASYYMVADTTSLY